MYFRSAIFEKWLKNRYNTDKQFKGLSPNTISTAIHKLWPKSFQNFLAYLSDRPQKFLSSEAREKKNDNFSFPSERR
ncbi:MAG: hypothetical protein ABH832_01280 [bacterium]